MIDKMERGCILSIDRGQSQIKTALCGWDGEVLDIESCQCQPIQVPHEGWAWQDMDLMWDQTVMLIKRLFRKSRILPEQVAAVSFSGQGGGNFLIDQWGKPVYPGVLSLDNRHEEISEIQGGDVPRTIAFMRWLKEKEPEIFRKTRWILGSKDWIRYCFTGKANADMSDTPAPVDFEKAVYRMECLEKAGVPECAEMLPPLVYSGEICGTVTRNAAMLTGIPEGTPVAAGAHDMIACSIGAGGDHEGHLAIILGTLGINIAVVRSKANDLEGNLPGERFVFGGAARGWLNMTTSIGSGCNTMNWVLDLLYEKEKELLKEKNKDIFSYIEIKLQGKEPVEMIFQPYLMGTFYNSEAKAGLLGMTAGTTKEEIIMSVYQGICISMCMEIDKLEEKTQNLDDIWLTGGGSKSNIWPQMFADTLGRPVHIAECSELGCRGAALCAGIALGWYSLDKDLPRLKASKTYYPREHFTKIYQRQKELYRYVYDMSVQYWKRQDS